ncbi:hypothetical protein CEXT_132191 [Caerostris extrusa]|uniref:Uncharacterized protein n=1 Tax=Caerostris extrusa TaxID=172846 RepID=A0AAV4Y3Q0_CAEEX|nr:hypothetical protein CEXT_132191 [Caerostris extrusa]
MRQPPMASTTFLWACSRFDDEVKFGAPGFGISGLVIIPDRKKMFGPFYLGNSRNDIGKLMVGFSVPKLDRTI